MFSKNYRGFDVPLKVASGSSWEHLRAYAAERLVPPRAVEARISGRCAVSRRREPPRAERQVLVESISAFPMLTMSFHLIATVRTTYRNRDISTGSISRVSSQEVIVNIGL